MQVMLLTTKGRKSGKERTTPLVCIEQDGDYFVTASNFGQNPLPGWYFNIEANPRVTFEFGGRKSAADATILNGDERDRIFQMFKDSADLFTQYEQSAGRVIPVVRLTPENSGL